MTTKDSQSGSTASATYEPTERERLAIEAFTLHRNANPSPPLKVTKKDGEQSFGLDHPKADVGIFLILEAIGSLDADFAHGLIAQLCKAAWEPSGISERDLNFQLAVIKGIKPKDQIEAMLAAQMGAVQMATM